MLKSKFKVGCSQLLVQSPWEAALVTDLIVTSKKSRSPLAGDLFLNSWTPKAKPSCRTLIQAFSCLFQCKLLVLELLEALPGVGHKTASVVMSQAFGVPAFPVDTHIHRLAQRWGLTAGKNVQTTERDLKRLFSEERWNELHLQIIFYGREFCTARGCQGLTCELCRTLYPNRKHPKKTKKS